jgi:integrase
MKRDGSQSHYFRQRIPLDVVGTARGQTVSIPLGDGRITKTISPKAKEIKISLQTADPSKAKSHQGIIAAHLEAFWNSLREGPKTLSHKEIVALSGELYHDFINALEDDPGTPELWQHVLDENNRALKVAPKKLTQPKFVQQEQLLHQMEQRFGPFADTLLARRSLIIDRNSRIKLLLEIAKAANEKASKLKKLAEGDYRDDDFGKRFPKWEEKQSKKAQAAKPDLSMMDLVEKWWLESERAGLSHSTYDGYKRTFENFCEFLSHKDASKVTPEDVVAFKDFRLQRINEKTNKQISPKTVRDGDLAGLKSVFGWALNNRLLKSNPALGVQVKVGKAKKVRAKYFSDAECTAILTHAQTYQPTGWEKEQFSNAKRWVPWICAYTGARVGEILQLRKQDIAHVEGHWTYKITPEAGQVKTGEYRIVPIHDHLIEMGFLTFVEQCPTDYLFILATNQEEAQKQVRTRRTKMSEFIREVFTDRNLQPNHGWRHTFKTKAREIESIKEKVLDDITGHASRTEGDRYGESTIKAKAQVIKKYPRYEC